MVTEELNEEYLEGREGEEPWEKEVRWWEFLRLLLLVRRLKTFLATRFHPRSPSTFSKAFPLDLVHRAFVSSTAFPVLTSSFSFSSFRRFSRFAEADEKQTDRSTGKGHFFPA